MLDHINISKEVRKLHREISPTFRLRDLLQIILGATILAVPVGFTQETWELGEKLPIFNIFMIMAISLCIMGSFVYYHYYRHRVREHLATFGARVLATYLFSFLVVALILATIQIAPWHTDIILAFKRTVIVSLPASMGAAVVDTI
jgi:uncharacterized membrane protein